MASSAPVLRFRIGVAPEIRAASAPEEVCRSAKGKDGNAVLNVDEKSRKEGSSKDPGPFRHGEASVASDPNRSAARPGSSGGLPPPRSMHMLYTPEQMRAVMYRERARADRNGHEFSLVVLRADPETRRRALRLARTVSRSSRVTDEIGRFDELQICALLPDTPSFGAWCFARRLCDSARRRAIRATCRVYTYPTGWMDAKRDNGNGNANGDGQGPAGGQPLGGRLAGEASSPAAGPSDLLARDATAADRNDL